MMSYRRQTIKKSLNIAVLDLVARQPTKSLYARIMNPNYTSVMPQFLAVWLEELGHRVHYTAYTGFENLYEELPDDIDVLFISTFTQTAFTAYSISNIFRQKKVITVLGGPHARSFAEDSKHHFDYVLGLTNKDIIRDLLADCQRNPEGGIFLAAKEQTQSFPSVRQRWKFIEQNFAKAKFLRVVPMIGSVGCPYSCSFCIDAPIAYQGLSFEQTREDLVFLASQPKPPFVGWYDPNFGVRFNEIMDVIESAVKPGTISFGAESTLSLLSEPNLKRLQKNSFVCILPGIESWFGYNSKAKQRANSGIDKVKSVAEHINLILNYIPYIQTNHVFGLDCDYGPEPFELTKRFVDLAPGTYPTYMVITSYGNSAPLSREYQKEGRVFDMPFPFLDGNSGLNVRLKNYSPLEFYNYMSDLVQYTFSARSIWRRFKANKHPIPRWMNLLRALLSGKGRSGNFHEIHQRLKTDPEFDAFYGGASTKPPAFYHEQIRQKMGMFYQHLPEQTLNYLNHGEPSPNVRIANALMAPPVTESNAMAAIA